MGAKEAAFRKGLEQLITKTAGSRGKRQLHDLLAETDRAVHKLIDHSDRTAEYSRKIKSVITILKRLANQGIIPEDPTRKLIEQYEHGVSIL